MTALLKIPSQWIFQSERATGIAWRSKGFRDGIKNEGKSLHVPQEQGR